jgi:hypothetical protein
MRPYTLYAMIVLGMYSLSTWSGWELFAARRGMIPQDVRQAPGGYRSYNYWRGGK